MFYTGSIETSSDAGRWPRRIVTATLSMVAQWSTNPWGLIRWRRNLAAGSAAPPPPTRIALPAQDAVLIPPDRRQPPNQTTPQTVVFGHSPVTPIGGQWFGRQELLDSTSEGGDTMREGQDSTH